MSFLGMVAGSLLPHWVGKPVHAVAHHHAAAQTQHVAQPPHHHS